MKQLIKKCSAFILATVLCVMSMHMPVHAATANVSIALSGSSLTIGDTVTATVSVSTDAAIGSYSLSVSYDSSVLEYTGGSGSGGGGTVLIAGYGDGSQTRLSATLNFKAIGNGSTSISTSGGEAYGWDESVLEISHAGATVTVSAPQAPEENTSGNGNGDSTQSTQAPLTGSGDNYLKSLEISPGTLQPAFQSKTTSYTVQLPEDTKSIVVSAVANDSKAKVSVSHNNDLEPGANKTYIVVTAENGTQRTYVLNVNCGEVEEEPEPSAVTIDGVAYSFATAEQMAEVTIPEGFTAGEETYEDDVTVTVYKSPNQLFQIVYLLDAEEQGSWFIWDKEAKVFTPYMEFQAAANRYIIVTPDETVAIPVGFEAVELEIQGQKITAYAKDGDTEFVLVYAMNISGEAGFYWYDTKEGTYQRYVERVEIMESSETTEENTTEVPVVSETEIVRNLKVILYILSGVAVILLGFVIGFVIYLKKGKGREEKAATVYADLDDELTENKSEEKSEEEKE